MWVLTSLRLPTASILGCCCPKEGWWIRDSHFGHVEAVFGPMEERLFCDLGSGQPGERRERENSGSPSLCLLVVCQWGSDLA